MKISDLYIQENRNITEGYPVDIVLSEEFIQKYHKDTVPKRKACINKAANDLFAWYNRKGNIIGKLKINDGSDNCYHYHIGFPEYTTGYNHQYSTSDWFILYNLTFDNERDLYVIYLYDYDHHKRRGDWNQPT